MFRYEVDTIPEGQEDFYAQDATTKKFLLKVEGVVPKSSHDELKAKVDEFRSSNNLLKQQIEELGGLEQIADAKAGKGVKATIEELVKTRTTAMQQKFEEDLKAATTKSEARRMKLRQTQLNDAVKSAALEHGVLKEAVDDVLSRVTAQFEMNDDDELVAVGGALDVNGKPLSVKAAVTALKEKARHLFAPSDGTGQFNRSRNGGRTSAPTQKSSRERLAMFNKDSKSQK